MGTLDNKSSKRSRQAEKSGKGDNVAIPNITQTECDWRDDLKWTEALSELGGRGGVGRQGFHVNIPREGTPSIPFLLNIL